MHVQSIASTISDNFFYLVTDGDDALLVDPIDAKAAIAAVREVSPKRVRLFATHGHPDHVGGNDAVVDALGCEVIGSGHEGDFPFRVDSTVMHGDVITVGTSRWQIRHAPGHTRAHVVAYCDEGDGALLSGDVYFVGGTGHCRFGGDPPTLFETVSERLADIPSSTAFYPGHDYAVKNLEFALSIEPTNDGAAELLARAKNHTRAEGPVLTTLGEERAYNPFHRAHEPALWQALAALGDPVSSARDAFLALRLRRDTY
ncbi:MAG: hydroxyacylglutathione hydrolase [Bradymonadia bacterium]|jgi:hydroxyacylglutathione hydrolase